MATPVVTTKYRLRVSSPIPKFIGSGCPTGIPTSYVLQSFGVEVSNVDNFDDVTGLFGSEVMQGLQNYEDTDLFRQHSYVRINYTGTENRDSDGNQVFRASEEHTSKWVSEEQSGLIWIS